jgi:uncharacterized protein YgiM (DUF1202 family)
MMRNKRLSLASRGMVLWLAAGATLAGAAAMTVYVNADSLDIVAKPRTASEVVTTVDRGTPLQVIERQARWTKVSVGGKQGYVANIVLSDKPTGAKGSTVTVSSIKQGGYVPQLETAAAVKGVGEGARQYANSKSQNTRGLEELFRRRGDVTPQAFDAFLQEGGLKLTQSDERPGRTVLTSATNAD